MFYHSDEDETDDENSDEDSDEEISGGEVSDEEVSDESSDNGSAVSEDEEMKDAPVTDEPTENVVLLESMSRGTVRCFVLSPYNKVCDIDYAALGAENDFEDRFMVKCIIRACQEVGLGDDFSIRIVDIPQVRGAVMRMVRRHKGAGLTFEQWHYWTMEMQRAVKWQHEDVAAPEDDARVVYAPLTQAQTIYQQWQARERAEEAAARNREAAAQARLAVWQPGRPF